VVIFEEISGTFGIGAGEVGSPAKAVIGRHNARVVAPKTLKLFLMTSPIGIARRQSI
jgi:hypothetical protein